MQAPGRALLHDASRLPNSNYAWLLLGHDDHDVLPAQGGSLRLQA